MTEKKHYVGEVGTIILLDTGEDVSDASSVAIKVQKPDGTEATWAGEVYQNNYVKHALQAGDLDQEGAYQLQAYVAASGSYTGRGETVELPVYANFK